MAADTSGRIPVDESFGNLMLAGLQEINLPEPISLWPQAPGWKYLALVLCVIVVYCTYWFAQRWWKNRYRRAALSRLSEVELKGNDSGSLNRLAFLIKATALQIYPRTEIASLSGPVWFAYLNKNSGEHGFDARCIELLGSTQYRKSASELARSEFEHLIQTTKLWLRHHPLPDAVKHPQTEEETDV